MITVVGESLVDVVARTGHGELTVHPGGSPANVAVALSRLGQRTALVTQIGADDYGALIRTHLERNGVGVILAGPPGRPTSRALATLDARGAASYEFDLSWDVRGLRLAEGSAAMHIGSLGVMLTPGGEQVLRLAESVCRRGDVVTSYDPNARPSVTPDRRTTAATVHMAAASADIGPGAARAAAASAAWSERGVRAGPRSARAGSPATAVRRTRPGRSCFG